MKEIQVEILPDGMAIEVNRLGIEPPLRDSCFNFIDYWLQFEDWQLAESQRMLSR